MIAQELEVCLHRAFVEAREQRHEFITVEHLLLALLDCPTAAQVLRASSANTSGLREKVTQHITQLTPRIAADREVDTQPTLGFQRVIQRAILHVQSSGKKEVTGAHTLAAIFGEKDSQAVRLLKQYGVSRLEVADEDTTAEPDSPASAIARELDAILSKAFEDARKRRNELVTVEHMLLALLDNQSAVRVLRGCGVKVQGLRRELALRIATHAPQLPAERELDSQPDVGFRRVVDEATSHAVRAGWREATGADVLVAMLNDKDSPVSQLLAQHGLTRYDAVFYLTYGVGPMADWEDTDLPEGETLEVVLHNDHYTPMQFVVEVLQKFFSMTQLDANEAMLTVHREGIGLCGVYPRDEAVALMNEVLKYAREHGHPLSCTLMAPQ